MSGGESHDGRLVGTVTPETIRLEYLGRTPRTFSLPIPFVALSAKTGEVTCDPIGVFPAEDAERLLEMAPEAFRRVDGRDTASPPPTATSKRIFTVPNLPPLDPAAEPMLHEKLAIALRRRVFKNAGVAALQRNKYFPGAVVLKRPEGGWEIVDAPPSPPPAEGAEESDSTAVPSLLTKAVE